MTEATVKTYVSRMLTKLGLTNRTQAAILAYEAGLAGRRVRGSGCRPADGKGGRRGRADLDRGLAGLPAAHRHATRWAAGAAAQSPALGDADPAHRDRRPGRPLGLPVLRGRLRAEGLRQGRARSSRSRATRTRRSPAAGSARRAARRQAAGHRPAAGAEGALPRAVRHRVDRARPRRPRWRWSPTGCSTARDEGWQDIDDNGHLVNRTLGIASLGGATLDNEENYLIKKLFTALGAIQIENQARI